MADVRPFRALQYAPPAGPLGSLLAPPYDVISPEERRGLLARSPYNAVRLILPEVGYEEVATLIAAWEGDGVLERAERPVLVAWTQTFTLGDGVERERRTLLGAVTIEPYEARVVRPHERTHAGPKEDRLRLTRAVRTNLSPVFGLYPDAEGAAWAAAGVTGAPHAEMTDDDGVVHRFWRIDDPASHEAVGAALADRWILIADGHHRYETALAYRDERRAAGDTDPDAPHNHVLMGLTALDDPGLVVLPTHRVLKRWVEGAEAAFEARPVADLDDLVAALEAAPAGVPVLGLVRPEGMQVLSGGAAPDATPGQRLDVATLEREVLIPHLGADQAKLAHDGELTYVKDAAEAAGLVASGEAAAVFIMRGIPKTEIAAVSDAAETMPQKSTYFYPKLLTGVAFHSLVDA
ncbi:MAG: DUF1015 domain-containing protein [Thermoleophilia bacterium]